MFIAFTVQLKLAVDTVICIDVIVSTINLAYAFTYYLVILLIVILISCRNFISRKVRQSFSGFIHIFRTTIPLLSLAFWVKMILSSLTQGAKRQYWCQTKSIILTIVKNTRATKNCIGFRHDTDCKQCEE